jgi:hypothetical protein
METAHLQPDELALLFTDDASSILHRIASHLARGCEDCRQQLAHLVELQERFGHWDPGVLVPEAEIVEAHLQELLASPTFETRAAWLDENPEVAGWCLSVRLLELSEKGIDIEGLHHAHLALWVAERLGPAHDLTYVADLQARCLARCGALLKSLGEPNASAEALCRARLLADKGTGDPALLEEVAQADWG